ncbi:MAG: hypothetical protein V1703_02415, partial [Candidatus Altiarchaeota archaeon]
RKGRNILNPYETKVWFVLAVSAVALLGVVYNLFGKIFNLNLFMQNSIFTPTGSKASMLAETAQNATGGVEVLSKSGDFAGVTTTLPAVMHNQAESELNMLFADLKNESAERVAKLMFDNQPLNEAMKKTGELANATTTIVSKAVTTTTTKISSMVETTTTTLVSALQEAPSQLGHAVKNIPLAEVLLALALTLVVGLCIGILVKKRRPF